MKRLALPLGVVVLLASPALLLAATQSTRRSKNEVREGPGNYYPLVRVLPRGVPVDVLGEQGSWVHLKLEEPPMREPLGWLAVNCLSEKGAAKSALELDLRSQAGVTPASVSAAVRGFAQRYGRASASSLDSLERVPQPAFTLAEYQAFKKESPAPRPLDLSRLPLADQGLLTPYETSLEEDGIGLGLAARVAAEGLSADRAKLRYLNMLATVLSEASEAYDRPFRVFVTTGTELNAVAVPGGYLFLSRSLIGACRDEAELAGVIAHEMTHVIRRHGLKELRARKTQLHADAAMDELDKESGSKEEAETELEDYADEAYELAHKPRLQAWEQEADAGAVLLLARAGYDPRAVGSIVSRVGELLAQQKSEDERAPFAKIDFKKRVEAVQDLLRALAQEQGSRNAARMQREMGEGGSR